MVLACVMMLAPVMVLARVMKSSRPEGPPLEVEDFIINFGLPSDIGANIGSYSVAVAGMDPTREVKLLCIVLVSI